MIDKYKIKTFAKINLSLIVYRPRRKDGYHPLCSIFQTISLADEMNINLVRDNLYLHLSSSNKDLPLGQANILYKIYEVYKKDIPFGINIHLKKRIPISAGLGGGSSNAAAFLAFLNKVVGWGYTFQELSKIALKFGADVPYFLQGGTALVRGIGEKITRLKENKNKYFLLINPNFQVSTARIYSEFDKSKKSLTKPGRTPKIILKELLGENSLKSIVFKRYTELACIEKFVLDNNGPKLYMSGSGATLFIPFQNYEEAKLWEKKIKKTYSNWFIKLSKSELKGYQISNI